MIAELPEEIETSLVRTLLAELGRERAIRLVEEFQKRLRAEVGVEPKYPNALNRYLLLLKFAFPGENFPK
jgi:hypothetical protein